MNYWRMSTLVLVLLMMNSIYAAAPKLEPAFESLIDKYLAEFRGVGKGPSAKNDGSATYFENRLDTARGLLEELEAINRQALTFQQDIDYRYLQGILKTRIMDDERLKYWQLHGNGQEPLLEKLGLRPRPTRTP